MHAEVKAKMNRLCSRYSEAQSQLAGLRPVKLPTRKNQVRVLNQGSMTIGQLNSGRQSSSQALVKLAYVRGMRGINPDSRIGPEQEPEVEALVSELDNRLAKLEWASLLNFRQYMKKLVLAQTFRERGNVSLVEPPTAVFPLEQHVRASVGYVVDLAEIAGGLSATHAGAYDGSPNAD